ncbi:melanoma-associated antigen G1-like [Scleropages formosus]|uniref:Melanoma-associated antigen G1-like n=1 Tax=Scleropages formosus TaxID=113540 RepID=A0A0P7X860_SCLFO|nr:melanoma-associated antigen G1-like [Scleropages formosus]
MSQKRRLAGTQSSQSRVFMPNEVVMEEDEDVSFTQPSSSQLQRGLDRLTPAQVDRKVAEVVQFILIKDQKKVPIKRADIVKNVIKEYKNIYPEIIKRANMKFEKVFGFQLVEVDPKNHAYILVNKLEQNPRQPAVMYLEYTRIPHTEPLEHEFRWGVRAEKEVDKMKMLEFVSQVHDQEPQTWTKQYKEAMAAKGGSSRS